MIRKLLRLELYDQGLSDEELAKEDDVKIESIVQWRYRNNLPCNSIRDKSIPLKIPQRDNRIELYNKGLNYTEIAKELGLTPVTISIWFRKRGFKANIRCKDNRIKLYNQGLTDKELAWEIGVSASAIGQWRRLRGLKPNKKNK